MIRSARRYLKHVPWPLVQLKSIAKISAGGKLKLTKSNAYVEKGFTAFSAAGPDGFVSECEHTGEAVILSAIGARCGKAFFASGQWTTLANTCIIRADTEKIDHRFLWYLLNDETYWHRSGTAQPFISPYDIRNAWIPLPPYLQQLSLVEKLDNLHKNCDQQKIQWQHYQNLYKAFCQKLQSKQLIATPYDMHRLRDIVRLSMGEVILARDRTPTGVPVFSADNSPKPWGFLTNPRRIYPKGTIVIAARGSIGNPRLPDLEQYTSTQTTMALFPSQRVLPHYLHAFLKGLDFMRHTAVQAVPMLTIAEFGSVQIPLPSLTEQQRIAEIFEGIEKSVSLQKQCFTEYSVLCEAFKRKILYFDPPIMHTVQ